MLLRFQASLWTKNSRWNGVQWMPQVPLGRFKSNLRAIISQAMEAGAVPLLITAPSEPRLAEPGKNWFKHHSMDELADHEKYAQAVREVSAETGTGLVDFDARMKARSGPDPRQYFNDFVHLNVKGHRMLADMLGPWLDCAKAGTCRRGIPDI